MKNYYAITGMWLTIAAIFFFAVPGLNLLLAGGGIACGIVGIRHARKHNVGKEQSWFDLIGGSIIFATALILIIAVAVSLAVENMHKAREETYLTNYQVDETNEGSLKEFKTRYDSYLGQYHDKLGQQDKYDKVKAILAKFEAESKFIASRDKLLSIDIEQEIADGSIADLESLRDEMRQVLDNKNFQDRLAQEDSKVISNKLTATNKKLESLYEVQRKKKAEEQKARKKKEKEKTDRIKYLKAKVRQKYNEFDQVTWYTHSSIPKYENTRSYISVYFYVDKSGHSGNLRIKNLYTADDWLFIEQYTIKTDTRTYTIDKGKWGVDRDNTYNIWEWYDEPIDSKTKAMLQDIASSKKVIIRYTGQNYYKDRTVGASEKKAISEMLELYDLMR